MLELFLVMFAVAVQSAEGEEMAAVPPSAVTAPVEAVEQEVTEAPPTFLSPAATATEEATSGEAPPAFLSPGAGTDTAQAEAAPVFLTPQPAAQAEAPPTFLAPSGPGLVAEPQVPSGKFTTATEVKPIFAATKANWIAVRLYEGVDYLYVTQIWSWRCGLVQMRVGVNGGPLEVWPLPPCHEEYATPNAVLEDDGNPLRMYPPNSIAYVDVEVTFDDLSTDHAQFTRSSVLMP
ncbi:MAG: hypothetical protein P1U75_15920 [Antarcticimicrobium sp.]|uniref:hypothetical protein n=1 Tax=Antarcticimicrobium sp. TaxID=2824147 RepID=UPI0026362C1C|nr:hypothetical protein [Antarcticimicrobium sp.]MDF1718142.1 hypothetical protein [Antarcticimicrobium sp.]